MNEMSAKDQTLHRKRKIRRRRIGSDSSATVNRSGCYKYMSFCINCDRILTCTLVLMLTRCTFVKREVTVVAIIFGPNIYLAAIAAVSNGIGTTSSSRSSRATKVRKTNTKRHKVEGVDLNFCQSQTGRPNQRESRKG